MAQFAGIRLGDVWTGRVCPRHARVCIEQQFRNPQSRLFDAALGGDGRLVGFTETSRATIAVYDALRALINGLGGKAPEYDLPVRQTGPRLLVNTIAEFTPEVLFRAIGE